MVMRSVSLAGAACLALAAEAIMIPSTVSMPGLTVDSVWKQEKDDNAGSYTDEVKALPISYHIPEKFKDLKKFKDIDLTFSKPAFFPDDDDTVWIQNDQEAEDDDEGSDFSITIIPFDTETVEVEQQEEPQAPSNECPSGDSLLARLCRFRNLVSSKVEHAKPYFGGHRRPCPKKLAAMAKAKADELRQIPAKGGVNKFWPHFHPGEPMPKHIWNGNHYFNELPDHDRWAVHRSRFQHILHAFCNGLRRFVTGFVIPVLIGVAAGMTASLVGMCVGTLLAWVWIKFVRGGRRGNAGAIVIEEVEAIPDEKEGLLVVRSESEDAPPVYVEKE